MTEPIWWNKELGLAFSGNLNWDKWGKTFRLRSSGSRSDKILSSVIDNHGSETRTIDETIKVFMAKFIPNDLDHIGRHRNNAPKQNIDQIEIEQIKISIWKCKNKKVPGFDKITPIMLKKAWPAIKVSLCNLYNVALRTSTFPDCWNLVLIPKGVDKDKKNWLKAIGLYAY